MSMATYKGIHGTSLSRSQKIREKGFLTSVGRVGPGIYFWMDGAYARTLAIGWYRQSLAENRYKDDKSVECVLIYVTLAAEDNEVLDLENRTISEKLGKLSLEKKVKPNERNKQKYLVGFFISELEKEMNIKFKIVLVKVAAPKEQYCDYPTRFMGAPLCCVARNSDCITVNRVDMVRGV
jgi:hypothetical protein